jgi:hypothetical protein
LVSTRIRGLLPVRLRTRTQALRSPRVQVEAQKSGNHRLSRHQREGGIGHRATWRTVHSRHQPPGSTWATHLRVRPPSNQMRRRQQRPYRFCACLPAWPPQQDPAVFVALEWASEGRAAAKSSAVTSSATGVLLRPSPPQHPWAESVWYDAFGSSCISGLRNAYIDRTGIPRMANQATSCKRNLGGSMTAAVGSENTQ